MPDPAVRIRTWTRASADDASTGLLGWISVEYGDLVIDNITLRRTNTGRFALAFPSRTAKNGLKHAIVRPVDDEARIEIERVIFAELGQRHGLHAAKEVDHG